MNITVRIENRAVMPNKQKERLLELRDRVRRGQRFGQKAAETLDSSELSEYLNLRQWASDNQSQRLTRPKGKPFNPCQHWRFQTEGMPQTGSLQLDSFARLWRIRLLFLVGCFVVWCEPHDRPKTTKCDNKEQVMAMLRQWQTTPDAPPYNGKARPFQFVTPVYTYVQTDASRRKIAEWKRDIEDKRIKLVKSKRLTRSETLGVNAICKEFNAQAYKNLAQYHRHYKSVLQAITPMLFSAKLEKRKQRRVRKIDMNRSTQCASIYKGNKLVVCKRYKLSSKKDSGNRVIPGKFVTSGHLLRLAKKHNVTLSKHDIVPNGEYVSNDDRKVRLVIS